MPQTLPEYLADYKRARTKLAGQARRVRRMLQEAIADLTPEQRAKVDRCVINDTVRRTTIHAADAPERIRSWPALTAHLRRLEREARTVVASLERRDTSDLPCGSQDGHLMELEAWEADAEQYAELRAEAWRAINAGQPFPR
jgi:hypothetical protein